MRNELIGESDLRRCAHLVPAWADDLSSETRGVQRWLREGRARGSIYQPLDETAPFGVGLVGFARRQAVEDWLGRSSGTLFQYLCRRQEAGTDVLLDEPEALRARGEQDLHALVFVHALSTTDPADARAQVAFRIGFDAYRLLLDGWGLSGVWHDFDARDEQAARAGGLRVVGVIGGRVRAGLERKELSTPFPVSMASSLFADLPCRLNLTQTQRRVAELALWRLDDESIADRLAISPETVRRHWRNIHQRMSDRLAGERAAARDAALVVDGARGPDRRQQALEYLFTNIQELRPR